MTDELSLHWYLVSYTYSSNCKYYNGHATLHSFRSQKYDKINLQIINEWKKIAESKYDYPDIDALITSISYLGQMTKTEFYKENNVDE